MLVILNLEQVISPNQVCQGCLLADKSGSPRWEHGKLSCGHYLGQGVKEQPQIYECQMGFKLANIE
jgi:hypothetical protein